MENHLHLENFITGLKPRPEKDTTDLSIRRLQENIPALIGLCHHKKS